MDNGNSLDKGDVNGTLNLPANCDYSRGRRRDLLDASGVPGVPHTPLDHSEGRYYLLEALKNKDRAMARGLISIGAEVNSTYPRSTSPLHCAVQCGLNDIVEMLLQQGANVNAQNGRYLTPLHLAVSHSYIYITDTLLQFGADVNATDNKGGTPLHCVQPEGSSSVIASKLISKGANVNAKMKDGTTPLFVAVASGHLSYVEMLLCRNVEVNEIDLPHLFISVIIAPAQERDCVDIASMLLNHGCKFYSDDWEHPVHPFLAAARLGRPGVCELLLQKGLVDVNLRPRLADVAANLDESALHLAITRGCYYTIKILLKYGADLDCEDKHGNTPLHLASSLLDGDRDIRNVELLMHGSDVNAVNKNNETIVDVARSRKGSKVFLLLHSSHILKTRGAGLYVSAKLPVLSCFKRTKRTGQSQWQNLDCNHELARLKTEKIPGSKRACSDILGKSLNAVALIVNDEGVEKLVNSEDFLKEFPMYGNMIIELNL